MEVGWEGEREGGRDQERERGRKRERENGHEGGRKRIEGEIPLKRFYDTHPNIQFNLIYFLFQIPF